MAEGIQQCRDVLVKQDGQVCLFRLDFSLVNPTLNISEEFQNIIISFSLSLFFLTGSILNPKGSQRGYQHERQLLE